MTETTELRAAVARLSRTADGHEAVAAEAEAEAGRQPKRLLAPHVHEDVEVGPIRPTARALRQHAADIRAVLAAFTREDAEILRWALAFIRETDLRRVTLEWDKHHRDQKRLASLAARIEALLCPEETSL